MDIDLDRVEKECREFMSVTPTKSEFLSLIDRLRSAENELASLPAKWSMDSSLQTWFPLTSVELENLRKEVSELRAYKEAMEKQEPVQWVCELASNPWPYGGGTRRDTKEEAINYINSESNHCKYDTVSPIYRLPLPDDKPAVAVPDGWKLVPDINTPEMEKAFHKGVGLEGNFLDGYESMLAAAPSHSQQSAQQTFELLMRDITEEEPADPDSDRTVSVNYDWLYARVREAFCPSHESEQLQKLRAHGLAENQQKEEG